MWVGWGRFPFIVLFKKKFFLQRVLLALMMEKISRKKFTE